jgi:hypothetical protein
MQHTIISYDQRIAQGEYLIDSDPTWFRQVTASPMKSLWLSGGVTTKTGRLFLALSSE